MELLLFYASINLELSAFVLMFWSGVTQMYFFNALTAVDKRGKERGGVGGVWKYLLRGAEWGWFWFLWQTCKCSSPFPSSHLGAEISGTQLAEKVVEAKGVSSMLNTTPGLECDAVNSTFSHTRASEKEEWTLENANLSNCARQWEHSVIPSVMLAVTSHC